MHACLSKQLLISPFFLTSSVISILPFNSCPWKASEQDRKSSESTGNFVRSLPIESLVLISCETEQPNELPLLNANESQMHTPTRRPSRPQS